MRLIDLIEVYSRPNANLLSYLKNQDIDHYRYWHGFIEWVEQTHPEEFRQYLNMNGLTPEEVEENPETFYKMPKSIQDAYTKHVRDHEVPYELQHNAVEAPTWAHADLQDDRQIPRSTWLVHFSNDAYAIAREGFRYGIFDMTTLGLTTYYHDSAKKYGGYNFAFVADRKDAMSAAETEKYGKDAVLFQSAGVMIYHYGDEETQVIFWGERIDPRDCIYLARDDDGWAVQPHPRARRKWREYYKSGVIFRGSFETVVAWVEQNIHQYAGIITGR